MTGEHLVHEDGRWFYNHLRDSYCYVAPGLRRLGDEPKVAMEIKAQDVRSLTTFLTEQGHLRPPVNENRDNDVKIIHRLIDLLEGSTTK